MNNNDNNWVEIINSIGDTRFEELCYELIEKLGFFNVKWIKGPGDKGRDIEAYLKNVVPGGKQEFHEKWYIECKCHQSGISWDEISKNFYSAKAAQADKFAIMSNSHITVSCTEQLESASKNGGPKVVYYSDKVFQSILFDNPKIFKDYFPDYKIPTRFLNDLQGQQLFDATKIRFQRMGIVPNEDINKNVKEINIYAHDPEFLEFVEKKILPLPNLPDEFRNILFISLAKIAFLRSEYSKSLEYLDTLMEFSDNPSLITNKAAVLIKLGRSDEALQILKDQIIKKPDNPFAYDMMGRIYNTRNDKENAMKYFNKALDIRPDFWPAIENKVTLMQKMGKTRKAIELMKTTLEKHNIPYLWLSLSKIYLEELDLREALNAINKALKVNSKNVDFLNQRGVIYERNSRYQEKEKYLTLAQHDFEKCKKIDPLFSLGFTNSIVCKINKNEKIEEEEISTLKTIFPNEPHSLEKRGVIEEQKNNLVEAKMLYHEALNIDPNLEESAIRYAQIALKLNAPNRALRIIKKFLLVNDLSENICFLMVEIYKKKKNRSKVRTWQRKAQNLHVTPKSLIE